MPGVANTMSEFKTGSLHSGSKTGPIVRNRKQAIAIALAEELKNGGRSSVRPGGTRRPRAVRARIRRSDDEGAY